MRCHPWCSRHGGHLYRQKNKAFAHLIFNDEELTKLGCAPISMQKVTRPITTYRKWAELSQLNIEKEEVTRNSVGAFFEIKAIKSRLMEIWGLSEDGPLPHQDMEQSFIDYTLRKA